MVSDPDPDQLVTFYVEYIPVFIPIRPGEVFQFDTIKPPHSKLRLPTIVSDVGGRDYLRCIWVDET
jgi:hypothetical protein